MGISVDIWGHFCIERQKIVVKIYFNLIVIRSCHFSIEIIVINLIFVLPRAEKRLSSCTAQLTSRLFNFA